MLAGPVNGNDAPKETEFEETPSSSSAHEGTGELAKRKINTRIKRFIKESYGVSVMQLKILG
jgi:hypothetical protein